MSDEQPTIIPDGASEQSTSKQSQPLLIDDRFVVKEEIGRGGMGITYLAIDTKDNDNRVVVKVLLERPDKENAAWVEGKFRKEGEALSRIKHDGVVEFVSSGVMPDGSLYLVMEYVEGADLRAFIKPGKGVGDFERIASFIHQLGEAIKAAHDKNVIHRDLKPENIRVSPSASEERIKVIDFGIATVKKSPDEKTKTTAIVGSMLYMAPEQILGKPTAASDIYALGVIAYEMITGRTPFNPSQRHPLLELQRKGVRVLPKDLQPSLPEAAQEIILKALSFQPSARYKHADEFGRDLARSLTDQDADQLVERYFSKEFISTVPSPQPISVNPAPAQEAKKEQAEPLGSRTGYPLKMSVSILVLLIAIALAFFVWAYFSDKPNDNPKPNPQTITQERTLSYWTLAQKYKNNKLDGEPIRLLGGEMYFNTGDELQFFVTSADVGRLYMLSEDITESGIQYNLLFPTPKANNSSSSIQANAEISTDKVFFEGRATAEKIWIIWTALPVDVLESEIERWKDPTYLGEINDAAKVASIRNLLEQNRKANLQIQQDETNRRMVIKGNGDTIVRLLNLMHR